MTKMSTPLYKFLGPRYWLLWITLATMRFVGLLPMGMGMALGRGLGRVMYSILPKRRYIAARNIELAYPDKSPAEQERLVKDIFASLGLSVIETTWSWWASDKRVQAMQRVEGIEYLERALTRGKGVILLTAHFTTLELTGRMLCKGRPDLFAMYRRHRNPLFQEIMRRGRERSVPQIAKQDVREMIRVLKRGKAVWYAPDQAFRGKMSTAADFFGISCPTNTATARMAKMTGASVVPFLSQRLPGKQGYLVRLLPPLEDFSGDDIQNDTQRVNDLVESWIRELPDQYLWVHRRFKPGDEGQESPYKVNPHKKRK